MSGHHHSQRHLHQIARVVLGLGLAVVACALALRERPYAFDPTGDPNIAFASLVQGDAARPLAWSRLGTERALMACTDGLGSLAAQVHTSGFRASLATACLNKSTSAALVSPTASQAYLAQGRAWATLGQSDESRAALGRSQALAPNESWLARRRILAARDIAPPRPDGFDSDLAVLTQARPDLNWLAQAYRAMPDLAPFIIDAVDAQPEDTRRAFLAFTRTAGQ